MATQKKDPSTFKILGENALFIIVAGTIGFLIITVIQSVESLQFRLFARPDSLLFVFSKSMWSKFFVLFMSLGLILIFTINVWAAKTTFVKRLFGWLIGGVVVGNLIFFYVIFGHYYDVTRDAIYYNNTLMNEARTYSYEDIVAVKVHYEYSGSNRRRRIDVIYEVLLNDGNSFNAYNFWQEKNSLILFDQLLEQQGIPIGRYPPSSNQLFRLCRNNEECSPTIKYIYRMK